MAATASDRFSSFTEEHPSGCLVWTGATTKKGYGVFWVDGKWMLAHRYAFQRKHGWLPEARASPPLLRPKHDRNA